uniref:Uncharacterized protein n=1 Tax=Anguilla anguilla TaxID=7936 RepID=A0A0E9RLR2_ANGAN
MFLPTSGNLACVHSPVLKIHPGSHTVLTYLL